LVLVLGLSSSKPITKSDSEVFEVAISTHDQPAEDSRYPIYSSTDFFHPLPYLLPH